MSTAYAENDWCVVGDIHQLRSGAPVQTAVLGRPITVAGTPDAPVVTADDGTSLPVLLRYDHLWTTFGANPRPLFDIAEAAENGRTFVP
ncbi:MAG: aromatic ring-hydroxylating dioxygenase subunit alpha, partial [Pseudomonadota bacterium]